MKKEYIAPVLVDHGSATELTQGNKTGQNLDAVFPIHTPKDQLTFSVIPR